MPEIRYTLVSDGSSDRMLIPILTWLIEDCAAGIAVEAQWADLGCLRQVPRTLEDRLKYALDLYPCDLLFVHRDAEAQSPELRRIEIFRALKSAAVECAAVCVIPVRMSETWLLLDEYAIRSAAGNPDGVVALQIPPRSRADQEADPKEILFRAIRDASELRGRRLKKLRVEQLRFRVSELIENPGVLRELAAFRALEQDLRSEMVRAGWVL